MSPSAVSSQAIPLLQLELDAEAFASEWGHCDRTANYLARLASFDRPDGFLYANLFSTVLNELFEIVFCQHEGPGTVGCRLWRDGATDRIELEIPASVGQREFYARSVKLAQAADVAESYRRVMLGEAELDRGVSLLELAADYGARIWIEPGADDTTPLRLILEARLEIPELPERRDAAATP